MFKSAMKNVNQDDEVAQAAESVPSCLAKLRADADTISALLEEDAALNMDAADAEELLQRLIAFKNDLLKSLSKSTD